MILGKEFILSQAVQDVRTKRHQRWMFDTSVSFVDCEACRSKQGDCPVHKASTRKLVIPGQKQPVKFSYAIASFPEEVQLCVSSIPWAGCGVCAKQHIPVGTWIGPYEGKHVKCDDVKPNTDTSYMWEVRLVFCLTVIKKKKNLGNYTLMLL